MTQSLQALWDEYGEASEALFTLSQTVGGGGAPRRAAETRYVTALRALDKALRDLDHTVQEMTA